MPEALHQYRGRANAARWQLLGDKADAFKVFAGSIRREIAQGDGDARVFRQFGDEA